MTQLESDIDRLYQLPLEEFIPARNVLAKRVAGSAGARIKSLGKPTLAAWAVNQLYWTSRAVYESLARATERLRKAHKTVLRGGEADLREADKVHSAALDKAVKATLDLLARSGRPPSASAKEAIVRTLEALPADEPPGQLVRDLQPTGFQALSGIEISPRLQISHRASTAQQPRRLKRPPHLVLVQKKETRAREEAEHRKAVAAAQQRIRTARLAAKRAIDATERQTARVEAARLDAERARKKWEEAERRVSEMEKVLGRAREDARHARASLVDAENKLPDLLPKRGSRRAKPEINS